MSRIGRFLATPFGLATLGCLILAGWALWSGGILDGPMARQVRSSSVYAAPGTGLDRAAAERVIGNRRLVVLDLAPGADLGAGCDSVRHAAQGTLVLVLSRKGDEFSTYSCALLPGVEDENFGKAAVAETTIGAGIDSFADRPLDALKVVAVNYDSLVRAGVVPDGARTISPSLPRYLIAAAAILAVLAGATMIYFGGRRAARLADARRSRREAGTDARSVLNAGAAGLAQQIIDLDQQYALASRPKATRKQKDFAKQYRKLTGDYTDLLTALAADDDPATLSVRVEALTERGRKLAA
jgi:hypothetical protein